MRVLLSILFLALLRQTESATYINGLCVDCQAAILVAGAGSSNAAPLLRQLAYSFQLLDNDIEVAFVSQSSELAMNRLQTPCQKTYELEFAAIDYPIDVWKDDEKLIYNDLQSVPFAGAASVATYRIPGLVPHVDPDLILSRQNIYDIFTGSITNWNDTRLAATNEVIKSRLPNQTIQLVLTTDSNPSVGMIMALLVNVNSSYPIESYTVWPNDILNLPNVLQVQGALSVLSTISAIPYSFGILSLSYVKEAGLPDAKIENRAGIYVKAGECLGVYSAMLEAMKTGRYSSPADLDCPDCYPLSQMLHFVYHTDENSNCDSRYAFARFIHWLLTNENALIQIYNYNGFMSLPPALTDLVLTTLANLTCGDESLLQQHFSDFGNDGLTQALTIISAVLIFVSVGILSTLSYKRNNRITRAAGLAFALFFLLGCIFNYLSVIFWATIPTSTSICIARYSFVTVGYALILGAMFAKCWEISKIFNRAEKGDISPFKELPWWMFCRAFFTVVIFEVLFLAIWLGVDPPLVNIRVIDNVNLIAIHECKTHYPSVWYGLHFSYFGIVLFWGAYLAYTTRDIWQKYNFPNESRSILLSIYNLGFCCVILVPLVTALEASTMVLCFLISVAIIFPTTFALFVVHGPKMLAFLASSIGKGSKGSKNTSGPHKDNERPDSRHESHTVKLLKSEREKEALMEDPSGRDFTREHEFHPSIAMTTLGRDGNDAVKGIKALEDPKSNQAPSLGPSWKVLSAAESLEAGTVSSAFDTPEHPNPLFGENV